jgi:hypothetical protein
LQQFLPKQFVRSRHYGPQPSAKIGHLPGDLGQTGSNNMWFRQDACKAKVTTNLLAAAYLPSWNDIEMVKWQIVIAFGVTAKASAISALEPAILNKMALEIIVSIAGEVGHAFSVKEPEPGNRKKAVL